MRVSLVSTTYNNPAFLHLVLKSVRRLDEMPGEVVIADDGSGPETRALIDSFRSLIDCPVRHVWQEDRGFRAAHVRNRAVAAAAGDYLCIVDGDMVLHPFFIRDHRQHARPGQFIQGQRIRLRKSLTERAISAGRTRFPFWTRGLHRRQLAIRSPWLASVASTVDRNLKNSRGCNQSFWRDDLIRINGYNTAFHGWGFEDTELCARLFNAGLKRKYLRHAGLAYHLWHEDRSAERPENLEILEQTLARYPVRCEQGLDELLASGPDEAPNLTVS